MNWSMPRPALQWAGMLILTAWTGSFIVGILTAQPRGRLPGEVAASGEAGVILQAEDAKPFTDERIEGAPPPVELTEEEKAKLEEEAKAKAEALALARAEAEKGAPAGPEAAAPPPPAEKTEPIEKAPPPPKVEEPLY